MAGALTEGQIPLGLRLDPGRRFDTYHAGPNTLAVDVARRMAHGEGEQQALICGAAGRGKTHLTQAACAEAGLAGLRTVYVPCRHLQGDPAEPTAGLEAVQLVVLDDIQAICGLPGGELALFGLINRLRDSGSRLLMSSDRPPIEMELRLPDLVSRLGWGPVMQLRALDDADTLLALVQRAGHMGLRLSTDVAGYMLRRYPRDLPALVERLERLDKASLAAQRALTIPFVREVLG